MIECANLLVSPYKAFKIKSSTVCFYKSLGPKNSLKRHLPFLKFNLATFPRKLGYPWAPHKQRQYHNVN